MSMLQQKYLKMSLITFLLLAAHMVSANRHSAVASAFSESSTYCDTTLTDACLKRATLPEIEYKGNVGIGGVYGSNIRLIDISALDNSDYAANFTNLSGADQQCICWLKIGPDGGVNGFFEGNQAMNFSLPTAGFQIVAIDANTQGGCACGIGIVPTTSFGLFGSTWFEFDIADTSNDGWSGADASCVVSARYHLQIPALQVCWQNTCSTVYSGGSGTNAFLGGTDNEDGIGINIPPGLVRLQVSIGCQ